MAEYRFVCIDLAGTWQSLRYADLADDDVARAYAAHMLQEFPSILIYEDDRLVARAAGPAGPASRDCTPSPTAALTAEGCRAGRALLKWSTRELARRAGIAFTTINQIENGAPFRRSTAEKLIGAFAAHGVELLDSGGPGARLRATPG